VTDLIFHPVDPDRWSDFEQLFESRGGPKSCWCMVWRARGSETKRTKGVERKGAIEGRIRSGTPVGLLGYLDGVPVAWCSVGPRPTYRPLGGPAVECEPEASVWSIACFFTKRTLRGQGLTAQMIHAAIQYARSGGAEVLEAYPVDRSSPSYRFMGFVGAFEAAGFRHLGLAGARRHVMRFDLSR
jgi:GNAT superfamily N-acetyltransferase